MKRNKMLTWFGLKFNPFCPDIPIEDLYRSDRVMDFCKRVIHLCESGGFALITGEPGHGKSVALRILAKEIEKLGELKLGRLTRPQSNLPDFYQELGAIYELPMRPTNRWRGFKALREQWLEHVASTLYRPVLLIDEASLMRTQTLSELRLLSSMEFDSKNTLSVVLCGDGMLTDRFRTPELLPLGTRIRTRLNMQKASSEEMCAYVQHILEAAGNPQLMAKQLVEVLVDHSMGNYRLLSTMANELLCEAFLRELSILDEKLYLQVFQSTKRPKKSVA
ncbi:AAA family ATPase [bacterium]|jgi:type II secretory pathway predicted ATPase ExeA|nr:AAA family ATPase [bacterium]